MALDFVEHHAPDTLLQYINGQKAENNFTELKDFSTEFQAHFRNAWKAIELGSEQVLKHSIEELKQIANTELACNSVTNESCLNVCHLIVVTSKHTETNTCFYMSLFSYAAVNKREKLMKLLQENGADVKGNVNSMLTGSTLTQILVYSLHCGCSESVDGNTLKMIVSRYNGKELNTPVHFILPYGSCKAGMDCYPLELAMLNHRLDITQMMVIQGADPIVSQLHAVKGVIPLMMEYYEFGTNKYIKWLLHEHLHPNEVKAFMQQVLMLDIFNQQAVNMFKDIGRHHAHALLVCGHIQMAKALLEHRNHGGSMLLIEKDAAGFTALQVAADQGDLESIKVLLKMRKHFNIDEDKEDLLQALLVAARKDHLEVIACIIQEDKDVLGEMYPGKKLWKAGIADRLSSIFKVARDYAEDILISQDNDDNNNTLAHVAVYNGDPEMFKVAFLMRTAQEPFQIMTMKNSKNQTPLEVAVENDKVSILKILQNRAIERKSKLTSVNHSEENKWKEFWNEWGQKLVLHACSHGSGSLCLKILDEMGCQLSFEQDGVTPLSEAARNGNSEIVGYLLEKNVPIKMNMSQSPLLLAAVNGHSRCVQKLLVYNADVSEVDEEDYNCLMKAIINNHQKTVLVILSDEKQGLKALQTYKEITKPLSLLCCKLTSLPVKEYQTPMRMLIEHMPEIAEWVLHRCSLHVTKKESSEAYSYIDGSESEDTESCEEDPNIKQDVLEIRGYNMQNKYELLDDTWKNGPGVSGKQENQVRESMHIEVAKGLLKKYNCLKQSNHSEDIEMVDTDSTNNEVTNSQHIQTKKFTLGNITKHPIQLMVKHKREDLLKHPLIQKWIAKQWRSYGIPSLATYLTVYVVFLIFLTTFVVLLPRSGPDCLPSDTNSSFNGSDVVHEENITDTTDFDGLFQCSEIKSMKFLMPGSVIIIFMSIIYLLLELYQMILRGLEYLKEFENYVQLALFFFCLVFVFPVDNTCWCLSSWRWQIGALAVFLSWMNLILLLRYMPWVGRPVIQLINVYFNFIKLIYLPILLVVAFALPFYMLFIQSTINIEDTSQTLSSFANPWNSLLKVFLQTTGEVDGNTILTESTLVYPFTSFFLFIIFIIAVPVLFNNFLIGMAVGETEEERKKATFTRIKAQVDAIFQVKGTLHGKILRVLRMIILIILFILTCCFCCFGCCICLFCDFKFERETSNDDDMKEESSAFHERVKEHIDRIKSNNTIEETMQYMNRLNKHVNESLSDIQQQQNQTQEKLKHMETMLTQIVSNLSN